MIIIDGTTYDVPIISMVGRADALDKFAERDNSGRLHRELIGIYDNYDIEFGPSYTNTEQYSALWFKLTEPVHWHYVVFPTILGTRTIEGYFANSQHEVAIQKNGITHWRGLSTSFVSRDKRPS